MRRPEFKPTPPWRFRVILCDKAGNQVNDDVYMEEQIPHIIPTLIKELRDKERKKEVKHGREK